MATEGKMLRCPECNGKDLIKAGKVRRIKRKPRPHAIVCQRWLCYDCGLHTIVPKGLKR